MKKLFLLGNAFLAANTFSENISNEESSINKDFPVIAASYSYSNPGSDKKNNEKILENISKKKSNEKKISISVSYTGKFSANYDRKKSNENTVSNNGSSSSSAPGFNTGINNTDINNINNNPITSPNIQPPSNSAAIPPANNPPINAGRAFNQSTILASYKYPSANSPYWSRVTAMGGSKIPYVIINPGDGPGTRVSPDYTRQIQDNINAGIKNIGYVKTDYFNRSQADILAEVDRYMQFYGRSNISGIFFDETPAGTSQSQVNTMRDLYNYVKTNYPEMTVMANPGRNIKDEISPYSDIWLTSETNADRYINRFYQPTSSFENNPANAEHIYHIVYAANASQYEKIIELSKQRNAGWLMITTDVLPNPYDELPVNFESMVNAINTSNNRAGALISRRASSSSSQTVRKTEIDMPRSNLDWILAKNSRTIMYKNIETVKNDELKLDAAFIGNLDTDYRDKKNTVKYKSSTDGAVLSASKNFNKFTVGGAFGYQDSKIDYRESFEGIQEKMESYQLSLSGKYDFTDNISLTGVLTHSVSKHKYETDSGLGPIHDAQYKSKIVDLDTKLGYKYAFSNGYLKPYISLGITKASEGSIDKIGVSGTSKSGVNSGAGVLAQASLGKFDLYGNLEYEYRLNKSSYHSKRDYTPSFDISPLNYSRGVLNLETGVSYNINNMLTVSAGYGLRETKNSMIKFGLDMQF